MNKHTFLITAASIALMACTPTINKRGNMVDDTQLSQVTPNIHTRSDVLKIMGSPTTQAPFDDNLWYYIGQETEKRGILDPEVTKERIIAVRFDDQGTVTVVQEIDQGRIDIPIDPNKTETQGVKTTIAQEFLGNLGRFNNNTGQSGNQ